MAVRQIVQIDEALCNGCGLCVSSCAEGALQIIDGKARLVKDEYCDGLGACLGECPMGAITIIQRDAPAFDVQAVTASAPHAQQAHGDGCPGAMMRHLAAAPAASATGTPSALRQWPVQLRLVSPTAPYFRDADLLLAADCAAFACGDFHARFLHAHGVAIACPKLDDPHGYVEKLAAMITDAGIRSITVVMMQVPCCRGLLQMAERAMQAANQRIPLRTVILSLEGAVLTDDSATVNA